MTVPPKFEVGTVNASVPQDIWRRGVMERAGKLEVLKKCGCLAIFGGKEKERVIYGQEKERVIYGIYQK